MRYLITGAGSGIGRAVARRAAKDADGTGPVSLALVDRNEPALDALAAELTGAQSLTLAADLSDPEAPARVVAAAVAEFGGLDAVVSNAGTIMAGNLEELEIDAYEHAFAVNTRATWLLGKAAFPALRSSRGAIVATASISATFPTPPLGMYSASKAALLMIIRQMALEWGRYGIRANCVSPGPTDTGLTHSSFGDMESEAARSSRAYREALIPLRKIGVPDEVAEGILFLAGPRASQITGVDLPIDGGISVSVMPITAGIPGYRPDQAAYREGSA